MFWTMVILTCLAGEPMFGVDCVYVNRYRPEFTSKKYFAEIPENTNIGSTVIRVEAQDGDVGSSVVYSIERGNEKDAFEIDPKSGIIKTRKKLDYEKKSNYYLRIMANDGFYNAKSYVEIKITNVEDEKPQFKKSFQEIEVPEKSSTPECIANVTAYDPDLPEHELHLLVYSLIKNEDVKEFFEINSQGCLIQKKPYVCNPDPKFWRVFVQVQDKSSKVNVAEIKVQVRCEVVHSRHVD